MSNNTEQQGAIPAEFMEWVNQNRPKVESGLDPEDYANEVGIQHGWKAGAIAAYRKLTQTKASPVPKQWSDLKGVIAARQKSALRVPDSNYWQTVGEALGWVVKEIEEMEKCAAPASPVLRWIKASDRLPEAKIDIFFKYNYPGYPIEKLSGSLIDYGQGKKYFVSGGMSFDKWEFLEWLEETTLPEASFNNINK